MGKLYSEESDEDLEADPNMDILLKTKTSAKKEDPGLVLASSFDSLDDNERAYKSADETKTLSSHSTNTLQMDRMEMFNIPPPPSINVHNTFLPELAAVSDSSGNYSFQSNKHHKMASSFRDTDSDNNRPPNASEYHSTSIVNINGNHLNTMSSNRCSCCNENSVPSILPYRHEHTGMPGTIAHDPSKWHHCPSVPNMTGNFGRTSTTTNSSNYNSTNYEPPWDLAFPPLTQMGLHCQHAALNGKHSCNRNSTHIRERAPDILMTKSFSNHEQQALLANQNAHFALRANGTMGTTGSHSYEIPWDEGTLKPSRHHPPPCSPPPPPPGQNPHQPVQHRLSLPSKKPPRQCDWRCFSIFLMIAIFVLSGCVIAFAFMLVSKPQSPNSEESKALGKTQKPSVITDSSLGDRHKIYILPHDFVVLRFAILNNQFVKFNISIDTDAVIGVYGRRSVQASHIQYDFLERVLGKQIASSLPRTRRSLREPENQTDGVNTAFTHHFQEGSWYLSFYNDGPAAQSVIFTAGRPDKMATTCPNDCFGKGDCDNGVCVCFPGYSGVECSLHACPILCSGNGIYDTGRCRCFDQWKGPDCSIPYHHCISCSTAHGRCLHGSCVCEAGWMGDSCENPSCPGGNCSDHGFCHQGVCYCEAGYRGADCSIKESHNFTIACSNDCSGNGKFDAFQQICECETGWSGAQCMEKQCTLDCGNGKCSDGKCVCDDMWTGATCQQKICDIRCYSHGQCDNGTCICHAGWNGKHCTLTGCPNGCNKNGDCIVASGQYECACKVGWKGSACDIQTETSCSDNLDDDSDNLVDCLDPDCCSHQQCKTTNFCRLAADPITILQRTPRLSPLASFYDSKKFLVEADQGESIQTPSDRNTFDAKRVSVLRGVVLLKDGGPALGTRVEVHQQPLVGFTIVRENGTFDIMVNGGGSVTLRFVRRAVAVNTTVIVPWNTIVTIDPVVLLQQNESAVLEPSCDPGHDRYNLNPIVLPTWQHSQLGSSSQNSLITPESQVIQETLPIPSTDFKIVYRSSDTAGYKSTILVQLTPSSIPKDLSLVHLKISVEGIVHMELFEADPSLTYRYTWNRKNVYHQNVYGIVTALVSVGYQYAGCDRIFWDRQATTLSGFLGGEQTSSSRSISKGWSLDVQHFYNFQEGILHKGDGTNIYLKEKPKHLKVVLGNGKRRSQKCTSCDGAALEKELLAPVAIASDLAGNIYVADYNIIRRLSQGTVTSVLELRLSPLTSSGASTSYRYFMTVSPRDGSLFISDNQNKQILKLKEAELNSPDDITSNFEVVAGTGQLCDRGSDSKCGDGGDAKLAQLTHPKGIAINRFGEIYFVDDTSIRKINLNGVIETVIGVQSQPGQYVPIPCGRAAELYEVFLGWPTSIAFSPVDDMLHILDSSNNLILKVTSDNKVVIIAGRPKHCPEVYMKASGIGLLGDNYMQSLRAREATLVSVKSMTFAPNGDLYVIESDERKVNRVRLISTDGYISHYAGGVPNCTCSPSNCACTDSQETVASKAILNNPSSLTVSPDGTLHISDMGNLRVLSVLTQLPEPLQHTYSVVSSEDGHIYKFDRNGFHLQTTEIMTNHVLYSFSWYPKNSINGALMQVSVGPESQVIDFERDNTYKLKSIKVKGVEVCRIRINELGELSKFTDRNNVTTQYSYELDTGLLTNKLTSQGDAYFYKYDQAGRLAEVGHSTGEASQLMSSVDSKGATIMVAENSAISQSSSYYGNTLSLSHGIASTNITYSNDGSLVMEYPSGLVMTMEVGNQMARNSSMPAVLRRKIVSYPGGPVNTLEWQYFVQRWPQDQTAQSLRQRSPQTYSAQYNRKILKVHGRILLSFEYMSDFRVEVIRNSQDVNILYLQYNMLGLPTLISTYKNVSALTSVNITYNRMGQLTAWQRGFYKEQRTYTTGGQLESVTSSSGITRYEYKNGGSLPSDIYLSDGNDRHYQVLYDSYGNLASIRTVTGITHTFRRSVSLGFVRNIYSAEKDRFFIEDVNAAGKVLRRIYPSLFRRIYQRYADDGRLAEVLYDSEQIVYSYKKESHLPNSVSLIHDLYTCTAQFKTKGGLADQYRVVIKANVPNMKFADVACGYRYNDLLKVSEASCLLSDGSTHKNFSSSQAFSMTGHVSLIQDFSILRDLYEFKTRVVVSDRISRLIRRYDDTNMLTDVELRIENTVVYSSKLIYNSQRLINQWQVVLRDNQMVWDYYYDSAGNMIRVVTSDNKEVNYKFTGLGSLREVQANGGIPEIMELDSLDRVASFMGEKYLYDDDGYLVQKGSMKYQFNSKGHLINVMESGKVDIYYYYDALERLMVRRDSYGSTLQLLYTDQTQPFRLTHVYNFTSHLLTTVVYDDQGYVLALDVGSDRYYVMSDHSGSPLAVYDARGNLIKTLEYTVLGEVEKDTRPTFNVYLGFQGGFYDAVSGLVYKSQRWYMPLIGRWMDAGLPDIFSRTQDFIENPSTLNGYNHRHTSDTHMSNKKTMYAQDIRTWLEALGYDMSNLVPTMSFEGHMANSWAPAIHKPKLPLLSAYQCAYEKHMENFLKLSLVTSSKSIPTDNEMISRSLTPTGGLFSPGVILSLKSNKLTSEIYGAPSQLEAILAEKILPGATSLNINYTINGKVNHFFIKEDLLQFEEDCRYLGISAPMVLHMENEARVNLNYIKFDDPATGTQIKQAELQVVGNFSVINLRYGTNIAQEKLRIFKQAIDSSVVQAWTREAQVVSEGRRSQYLWTSSEVLELQRKGNIAGYTHRLLKSPQEYPELADDPSNIRFIKIS